MSEWRKKKPVRKHCATVLGMCMFGYLALIIAIVYYGQYCTPLIFSVVNRINFEQKRERNKSNPKKQQQQKKKKTQKKEKKQSERAKQNNSFDKIKCMRLQFNRTKNSLHFILAKSVHAASVQSHAAKIFVISTVCSHVFWCFYFCYSD